MSVTCLMTYLWLNDLNGRIKNIKLGELKYYVITKEIYAWVLGEIMLPVSNCDKKDNARY